MKNLTFVIFGGTGDLARKKLGSAINNISKKDKIKVNLIGIGRHDMTNDAYKKLLENTESKFKFGENLKVIYYQADITKPETFNGLNKKLIDLEDGETIGRICYLATSYKFFESIAKILSGFDKGKGFMRVMIEKPFGHDLKSSNELNANLRKYFNDDTIYRVDHYLAKETVDNILLMRFSNPLFENTWNSKFVKKIKINMAEDFGVAQRINYYNGAGAIKDMIQNHLLQVLLFILMNPPSSMDSTSIAKEKVAAIKSLRFTGKLLTGQYEGYRDEAKTIDDENSRTETFAEVHLVSKSRRWKGTDIILKTGKNLDEKESHVTIEYKKEPCIIYCDFGTAPNKLIFRIQPTQNVELTMNSKHPGDNPKIENVRMTFCPECEFEANTIESYEVLIRECVKGDKRLFICEDVLQYSWKITDKIIDQAKKQTPHIYNKGSKGPIWN